jgi:SAM-dependent methyltransferase
VALRSFEDVLQSVADVEGWMSDDQARRLFDAAASTRRGEQIVEIGSFRGRSTIVLASAAPEGVRVVAIDPHAGNDRGPEEIAGFESEARDDCDVFLRNLADTGVSDRVTHVRAVSDAAHPAVVGDIAVLYVDGAHRYAPARTDIRTWGRRVAPGGTMMIHDSFSSVGVTLAIARELLVGPRFRYIGRARSLAVYQADLPAGLRPRVMNALRQIAQLPWFAKNLLVKVLLKGGGGPILRLLKRGDVEWPY